jgi:hypothetical protein
LLHRDIRQKQPNAMPVQTNQSKATYLIFSKFSKAVNRLTKKKKTKIISKILNNLLSDCVVIYDSRQ